MTGMESVVHDHDRFARRACSWLLRAAGLLAALSVLIAPSIARADDISYLGPLVAAYPTMYEPLVLKAAKPATATKGKVQVILFDTLWDNSSAAGRWPIVKVLDQFGTWTGLAPGAAMGIEYPPWSNSSGQYPGCPAMPTYDLTLTRYSSKYVTFTHRVVQAKKNGPHAHLSVADQALFNKILHMPAYTQAGNAPIPGSGASAFLNGVLSLPAIAVGRYGVHGPGMGIMCSQKPDRTAAFNEIRQRVVQPTANDSGAAGNMNVFINTLVAGICKQDGGRPGNVCRFQPVKYILTRLK
jgi:hypothetical protein